VNLTAKDLAEYWLKCIHYNYDEYGLHKTNLRKGLLPPVSGWYNNWFKHCMGCPIRSEIWACIAPGNPLIAARYAYEDAICDHAGGESIYGEVFNACLEAAAFFLNDRVKLVEFGLQTIPTTSQTYGAVKTALNAFQEGLDWKEARQRVMKQFFHPIAQYSPINLGFQTIGLLYGTDFGDAICKAVNCGWDTDCTGATVGSIWGIIHGKDALPQKWLEPLGDQILLSKEIKNLTAPTNLKPLTDETVKIGMKVLDRFKSSIEISDRPTKADEIEQYLHDQIEEIRELWKLKPNAIDFHFESPKIHAFIEYPEGPAFFPTKPLQFKIGIINREETTLELKVQTEKMDGWQITPQFPQSVTLIPNILREITGTVSIPTNQLVSTHNGKIIFQRTDQAEELVLPLTFVGAYTWQYAEVIRPGPTARKPLKKKYPPEKDRKSMNKISGWKEIYFSDNSLEIEPLFQGHPGLIYLKHYIWCPDRRSVKIGVPTNQFMRLWLNGKKIHETKKQIPLRPNYGGDGANYQNGVLKPGWNVVMVKIIRGDRPIEAHFLISKAEGHHGMADVNQSRFPWD
jgi:hypothetical protein